MIFLPMALWIDNPHIFSYHPSGNPGSGKVIKITGYLKVCSSPPARRSCKPLHAIMFLAGIVPLVSGLARVKGVSQRRMNMRIGILSVKNHRYHPNRRLMEAARALNHQAILFHPGKLFMGVDEQGLRLDHVRRRFEADVILPRLGATIKEYAFTMIRHLELLGYPVINNYQSILLARNKFLTLQTLLKMGVPIPDSAYASNWSNLKTAVARLGGFPLVIKSPHSRQGSGVFLIDAIEKHRPLLSGFLDRGKGLLIQKFIPPEKRRDIRIMVVGKRVVGAMSLKPKKGEFRANIHLKGRAEKILLTRAMCNLAIRSVKALGLAISGVDMIEENDGILRVVDVNYSPGFKGLERCTGKDVAIEIIKYVTNVRR
jgi:ribosomal protein S6--L-glutamate ligase